MVWAVSLLAMDLITHSLSPGLYLAAFEFDKGRYACGALAFSVLYLR